jgi:ATP-dependent helicase HrpB
MRRRGRRRCRVVEIHAIDGRPVVTRTPPPLPIDELLGDIRSDVQTGRCLVIEAPPGAGKTTRVPPALLPVVAGEIVVAQPRRIAARMAARRVAQERAEELGRSVGYQVRFEDVSSPDTRIRFVTEGILLRRLMSDPALANVGAVVLDEFHERHLQGDLALALLRGALQGARPDLRIVVMSATLDTEPVRRYLPSCRFRRSQGAPHAVDIEYQEPHPDWPLDKEVSAAVRRLLQQDQGDILVFLPGAAQILRAEETLAELARANEIDIVPLHGELSAAAQDRAVAVGPRRKIILATNVAETSVTIEGVTAVVDSGLARQAFHSPWTGLPSLQTVRISQASAVQRAGRAGRVRAGRCIRLFTRHDFDTRPAHSDAEVRRLDLAEACLHLHALELEPRTFPWFEAPKDAAVDAAQGLLRQLGALDAGGAITALGRRLAQLPVHPRLGRLVVEGARRGVAEDAAIVAGLVAERDLRRRSALGRGRPAEQTGPSDVLDALERFRRARQHRFDRAALSRQGTDAAVARAVDRSANQLARLVANERAAVRGPAADKALQVCILAAFVDRVARRRGPRGTELVLAGGGSLEQDPASVVHDDPWMVVVAAQERTGSPGRGIARMVSAIDPDWLIELVPDQLRDCSELIWDEQRERVVRRRSLCVGQLALDERDEPASDANANEAAALLARQALAAGINAFVDPDVLAAWRARVAFARGVFPDEFPSVDDDGIAAVVADACEGLSSFKELRDHNLWAVLQHQVGVDERALNEVAPTQITLAGGRAVKVRYELHGTPYVAARLQDFFGTVDTPRIARGRVPVLVHLLAPNQRPAQLTQDLAGFWKRGYAEVRKELRGRYPRHFWPDDPTVVPPAQVKGRRRR